MESQKVMPGAQTNSPSRQTKSSSGQMKSATCQTMSLNSQTNPARSQTMSPTVKKSVVKSQTISATDTESVRRSQTNSPTLQLVGAIQQHFNIGSAKEMVINIPNLYNQKSIAKVLNDLNAKIELNNRINAELEAMAKTLYDYWFVQFDFPISAEQASAMGKSELKGKPYKSSGGKMVWNKELKREIPEGWEVGTLLDIADFTNGLACQKYRPVDDNFLPVIKIREMREGFSANTEKIRADIPGKLIVENGDILFSWSASLEVMLWSGGRGGLNQHIFKVTSKKYPKSFYYFQLVRYLRHFKMLAELRKTTMGHITQDHLNQSRVVIPPNEITLKLDKILNPIMKRQVKLNNENQQLASLRDWLLPMLMNGQVKVGAPGSKTYAASEGMDVAAERGGEAWANTTKT